MTKVKSYLRNAVVCVAIAFICLFGYLMLQNLFAALFVRWGFENNSTNNDLFVPGFWLTFLVGAVLVPVLEELVFRLLICKLLQLTKMADWVVILISAVVFALYHQSWSQTVYQLLMGIWLAWIFIKTHHITWTILIHFINNAFIITYTYFAGTGNGMFYLNAWNIVVSVVLAVLTTVAVFFLIKKGIPNYEK